MSSEAVSEGAGGRLFTRQATGLVRSVSPLSTMVFNTFTAPAAFVLAIALFWTLGAFPGANLYVALTLGYVSGFVFAFAISTVTSAIPRTGGDYVFVGRIAGKSKMSLGECLRFLRQLVGLYACTRLGASARPTYMTRAASDANPAASEFERFRA